MVCSFNICFIPFCRNKVPYATTVKNYCRSTSSPSVCPTPRRSKLFVTSSVNGRLCYIYDAEKCRLCMSPQDRYKPQGGLVAAKSKKDTYKTVAGRQECRM
ncbi:hypothetical protein V5799_005787 [Amblyomma americanum]|uniref:Uncharacterized protein n=1 Tax=Amblyomma americanum TaxID=6943 RepID=A0AAQ4DY93_AMBAM